MRYNFYMRNIFLKYWPFVKKYPFSGWLTVLAFVMGSIFEMSYPFLYKDIANFFTKNPNPENISNMFFTIGLLGMVYFFWWASWRLVEFSITHFEAGIMRDIEKACFSKIQSQSTRFFENSFAGSLVKKAGRFIKSFETIADWFFFTLLNSGLKIIVTFAIFIYYQPLFGIILFVWVILFLGGNVWFALWKLQFDEAVSSVDSSCGAMYADAFSNNATVRSFGAEAREEARLGIKVDELYTKRRFTWFLQNINFAVQGGMMFGIEVLLVFLMAKKWEQGNFSVGEFLFFQTYLFTVFHGLWDFGRSMRNLFSAVADAQEMAEIFDLPPLVADKKHAKDLKVQNGEIVFQNISFSYEEEDNEHFSNFSLHIPAGQKIGLVGHSGAGKTTLVKLLFRNFDIQKGEICIDDQNIAEVTQKSLREQITLVPQTPELFHRTLRENLIFAKENASEQELKDAIKKARAQDFIKILPSGLETLVGERGVKLSGGERQRIAIARAFLENAPIIILDEATSALDSITERKIQLAIFDLLKNRTGIVIAHRLSTILKMDRIVVLENGNIMEDGTHEDLLKRNGIYAEMWQQQSGGFLKD